MKGLTLITIGITFIVSTFLTYLIRAYAIQKAWLDIPNQRSSHTLPTPRGGGVAIAATFLIGISFLAFKQIISTPLASTLIAGGSIISLIGYLDDRYSIPIYYRLLAHFAGAGIALYYLNPSQLTLIGQWVISANLFTQVISLFAIVWFINLYNFMDGIDGLAAGEAVFVSVAVGLFTISSYTDITSACWILASAVAGFLIWNWPPAKIFMGDISSGLLGFIFAVFSIHSAGNAYLAVSSWMILLAVFIIDASLTLIRRFIAGEKWYAAHRSHAYQRLTQNGKSHLQVTLMILAYNILFLLPLAWVSTIKPAWSIALFIIAYIVTTAVWLKIVLCNKPS